MADLTLEIKNICKFFPAVRALDNVSITARGGEITGLIGVNGAGKSTLMNVLGGVHLPTSGEIVLHGEKLDITCPQDAERFGIGFIHQEPIMFDYMTVAENVSISRLKGAVNYKDLRATARRYLDMMGCDIKPDTVVEELSIGDRQMVEIVRALSSGGKVLLFDEPTASFTPKEKERLFEVIRGLKREGAIIFFISHFLDEVEELTDQLVILRDGKVVVSGRTADIPRSEVLLNMIGGEVRAVKSDGERKLDHVVFRAEHLKKGALPDDVSFDLNEGEVVGLWGLMGSGRTELVRLIYGLDAADSGRVLVDTGDGQLKPVPFENIREYCGYVTESRHTDGIFLPWTIWENIAAPNLSRFKKKGSPFLDYSKQKKESGVFAKRLNVKAPDVNCRLDQLSGGNQQKVIMAKWLMRQPKIFFLDEPTRGVDVGAKAEIQSMILDLARSGTAVLVISSEIEEISTLCDRVMISNRGRKAAEVAKKDIDKETIMSHCV